MAFSFQFSVITDLTQTLNDHALFYMEKKGVNQVFITPSATLGERQGGRLKLV
jgi:hypothetical protein